MGKLFGEIEFDAVSPSRFAMDVWEERLTLPCRDRRILAHRELVSARSEDGGKGIRPGQPLRVAYLGYPITHKGWPVFSSLTAAYSGDDRYAFYHMGIGQQYNRNITFVDARTTGENLDRMVDAVKENEIDVVVLPSIWPETFSLTAYEAVSAGCFLLASVNSGNIAALIGERQCGMVYENEQQLQDWFEDGTVVDKVRVYRSDKKCFKLVKCGITAPLILEACGI
jgi:hypothetical protein